jgi:hypothetical protein
MELEMIIARLEKSHEKDYGALAASVTQKTLCWQESLMTAGLFKVSRTSPIRKLFN